jgi:hypothetical protein
MAVADVQPIARGLLPAEKQTYLTHGKHSLVRTMSSTHVGRNRTSRYERWTDRKQFVG